MKRFLAVDLGAGSGRHIVRTEGESALEEVYRFPNFPDMTADGPVWDLDRLWNEVRKGIRIACAKYPEITSVGIDAWGVDYVLMAGDRPLPPVYSYRNGRTGEIIDTVHRRVSREKLYRITGIQPAPINTLYQLFWDRIRGRLDTATDFLMLPSYFFYRLTGIKTHEITEAGTTGILNVKTGIYDRRILRNLDLPERFFPQPLRPEFWAPALPSVADELGFRGKVVLGATHDTAAAVAGVPLPEDAVFLSSGTWSIMGVRRNRPILVKEAFQAGFSNEMGADGINFLKNIPGMWILQRLKAEWECGSFEDLVRVAEASRFSGTFPIEDPVFLNPESMDAAVREALRNSCGIQDLTRDDCVNAVFRSLSEAYGRAVDELQSLTDTNYSQIVLFGGGANNAYLNRLVAARTRKKVEAHPIEATAIGNLHLQEKALRSMATSRDVG
jgi:rhamnulokinase